MPQQAAAAIRRRERLRILNRDTGTVQSVPDVPNRETAGGVLTSRGTFFRATDGSVTNFYEWAGGTPRLREGETNYLRQSPVSKRYLLWPLWQSTQGHRLVLRDVLLGRTTLLGNGNASNSAGDVSDYGEAVFLQGPEPANVFRYRSGTTTQLTHSTTYSHFGPLTDGVNVVYRKQVSGTQSQIAMYNDTTGEVVLRPATGANSSWFIPGRDYQPSGGWVAFTRIASIEGGAYRQVWVRSPQGVVTPLSSAFETDSFINGVRNGQVMFVNGGYLYLGRPGLAPRLVAPYASGVRSLWLGNSWHLYYGGVLYRVAF
jgi:hypothetical protein